MYPDVRFRAVHVFKRVADFTEQRGVVYGGFQLTGIVGLTGTKENKV